MIILGFRDVVRSGDENGIESSNPRRKQFISDVCDFFLNRSVDT
jgi:hypothetical protein